VSIRSRLFALPMPGLLKKAFLRRLFRLTAEAFGAAAPAHHGSVTALLDRYAAFTRGQAEMAMRDSARAAEAPGRLFESAFRLGSRLRALLKVRRMQEAMDVAKTLYRLIGVDFCGMATCSADRATAGAACFTVSRCFFSTRYPPAVCRLISSLDAGLLAGLTGGGEMTFTERITEGAAACKGVIQ
jgi:hypothetical protein